MILRHLKKIRIIVSLFVLVFLILLFVGISTTFSDQISTVLLRLQFLPSLLRFMALFFSIATLGFLLIIGVTFLFGRVYCSSICPLGTLQDIFIRTSHIFKKKKKRKFNYSPKQNLIMRYSILGGTILLWIFGSLFLINLLDPYANFGRISASIIQPAFIWINNQLAFLLEGMNIYTVRPLEFKPISFSTAMVSGIILLSLIGFTAWRGRLFCNTICPVGSFLGVISANSRYRISFNEEACNKCGRCERVCKAECISSKLKKIDFNRCVSCFNCLAACEKQGLHYKSYGLTNKSQSPQDYNNHKRSFLLTIAASIMSIPLFNRKVTAQGVSKPGMIPTGTQYPIIPPGALSFDHYTGKCISCYLCVSACPKNVIVPTLLDFGLAGFMQPKLDYNISFCNFDCVRCTEVCPTGAITPITLEQKKVVQLGIARFMVESCIVTVDRTDCGACSEHCPTKAVQMVPYEGLFLPQVEPDLCIGCGACEYACPTEPYKAIYVESNLTHLEATPIEETDGPREVQQDDFPF